MKFVVSLLVLVLSIQCTFSVQVIDTEQRDLADAYIGRQMPNSCARYFAAPNNVISGKTCRPPCNNPCALDTKKFPQGCGQGSYCGCANGQNSWSPPKMACSWCPYVPKGTTCPGDGFYYDKSFAPAPIIQKAPTKQPVKQPAVCYDQTFGSCTPGAYCRQKSTDWTYVCTTPCPVGMTCPGDGRRVPKNLAQIALDKMAALFNWNKGGNENNLRAA